jgi:hypothetical protein
MGNIKKDKKRKKTFIVIISNSSSRVDHYLRGRELGLLLSLHPISDVCSVHFGHTNHASAAPP